MPTLFRFLFVCGTIVGLVYVTMWSFAVFVEPRERDVTVRIPSERINPVEQRHHRLLVRHGDIATAPQGIGAAGGEVWSNSSRPRMSR